MNRNIYFATLIMVMASWSAFGSSTNESEVSMASTAVLPPLPDLPIPGSKSKVTGKQEVKAVTPRKEEARVVQQDAEAVSADDNSPPPIVFKTDRAGQLVF
jgi:hypothetical protein